MQNKKKTLLLAVACCSVFYTSQVVLAAESQELETFALDQIVVTATRSEKKLVDTPANVTVITAEEITRKGYQSVTEALENVPGAIVTSNGFVGSEQHVLLNGEERVLFLVNGRRMNLDRGGGHGRQAFDLRSLPNIGAIEKIEVVKGASTTLYGTDAVGGIINIITKKGSAQVASLDVSSGSWGTENYKLAVGGKTDAGLGYYVTLKKSEQDYVKFKKVKNNQEIKWANTSYESTAATIRLDKQFDADKAATLTFEHSIADAGQPYNPPGFSGFKATDTSTILDNNVMAKYEWGLSGDNKGFVQIFRNHNVGNTYSATNHSTYTEEKDGLAVQQAWQTSTNNQIIAGFDANNSKVNNTSSFVEEKEIKTKAFYLHDTWNFTDSWQLNAGVRYDKHNYFGHETTASLALNKKFTDTSNAYISWNQIFNAPNGNDLFYNSSGTKGNLNLKPETGDVISLGYNVQASASTNISMSYFKSEIKDAIDWYDAGAYWTVKNVNKQKKDGFELSVNHKLSETWTTWAAYSYVNVKNSKSDAPFERDLTVRPNNYKLGLRYNQEKLNVELLGRISSGLSNKQYAEENYLTVDLSAQYKFNKNSKAYLKVYNLNNVAYSEKAGIANGEYSFPMPGRSILVGMEYAF